jgi:hypothetical protein
MTRAVMGRSQPPWGSSAWREPHADLVGHPPNESAELRHRQFMACVQVCVLLVCVCA